MCKEGGKAMKFIIKPFFNLAVVAESCRTDCLFDTHCIDCSDVVKKVFGNKIITNNVA